MPIPEFTCAGCGGVRFNFFFEGPDRMQERQECYKLWRCQDCGTIALHPMPAPEENMEHYPEDYVPYQPGLAPGRLARFSMAYSAHKQVQPILKKKSLPGRAVDIGCGTGEFLAALRKSGWAVQGMDINPRIARFVHQARGLDTVVGDSLITGYAPHSFDLIAFWDVLEHLPNPRQALQEAQRIARPSALLVISLPNLESLEARLFDIYWAGWDIPRHLWLFPKKVLIRLLEESGWEIQEARYSRGRHFLLSQSLRFWLQSKKIPRPIYRAILAGIMSWAARALLLPYFIAVERLRTGSVLVLYARKKNLH